uniref:lysozyme n=1 Tax=Cyprinus carpio carpio TaxID=630221 RepID=A0A9J8BC03_CYPCA
MKSVNTVKMLLAFALALLVCSVTEGRIMNKCELKAKLDAAQFQQITVMEETITVNSLITRRESLFFSFSLRLQEAKLHYTNAVRHLYGVFQLSDQWACDSGMNPSLNVCNMTCSALTDDDVTDDIACLKTLMNIT